MTPKDPIRKETLTKRVDAAQAEYTFPKEDKRETLRAQAINGSRPKSSL